MRLTLLSKGKVGIGDIDTGDKGDSRSDGQLLGRVQGRSSSRGLGSSSSRVVADGHVAKGSSGTDQTSSGRSDGRHVGLVFVVVLWKEWRGAVVFCLLQ